MRLRAETRTVPLSELALTAGASSACDSALICLSVRVISCPIWSDQWLGKKPTASAPPAIDSHVSARTVSGVGSSSECLRHGCSIRATSIHWNVGFPPETLCSSAWESKTSPNAGRHQTCSG